MQKHDKILVTAAIGLLTYTFLLSSLGPVVSSLVTNKTLGNTGSVKSVGVNVYWNSNGSNATTSFNWGMLDPDSTKSFIVYVKNEGNSVLTLSMTTSNWNPPSASQYMKLTWNVAGQAVNPGQIKQATFTLQVFANVTGINTFNFDVTVVGTS